MTRSQKKTERSANSARERGVLVCLMILFLSGMEIPAASPEQAPEEPGVSAGNGKDGSVGNGRSQFLDDAHAAVCRSMAHSARWFDSFFGDEREERDLQNTYLKLKTEFFWKESGELDFRQRVRIKLDLPQMEEKLKLILTSEREGEVYAREGGGAGGLDAEETSTRSFFRWVGKTSKQYNLHLDAGVRYRDGVKGFVELYGRRSVELNDTWTAHFRETIFWTHTEEFGESTRVDFEKSFSPTCFLRLSSEGLYSENSPGVEWRQDATFYREVGVRKAISMNSGVFGSTRPSIVTERYRFAFRYRQSVFRPWLFVEIEPEVNWYNERDWDAVPQMNFRCEIIFGGK